jgi:hypothetical protein
VSFLIAKKTLTTYEAKVPCHVNGRPKHFSPVYQWLSMALNLINRFSRIQQEYQRVNVDAALPLGMDEK